MHYCSFDQLKRLKSIFKATFCTNDVTESVLRTNYGQFQSHFQSGLIRAVKVQVQFNFSAASEHFQGRFPINTHRLLFQCNPTSAGERPLAEQINRNVNAMATICVPCRNRLVSQLGTAPAQLNYTSSGRRLYNARPKKPRCNASTLLIRGGLLRLRYSHQRIDFKRHTESHPRVPYARWMRHLAGSAGTTHTFPESYGILFWPCRFIKMFGNWQGFFLRFFGILWDSLRFFEILWDSLGSSMGSNQMQIWGKIFPRVMGHVKPFLEKILARWIKLSWRFYQD